MLSEIQLNNVDLKCPRRTYCFFACHPACAGNVLAFDLSPASLGLHAATGNRAPILDLRGGTI
jgi:hypothetical protein